MGLHYVCSDIHGRWDRYEAMMNGLNLNDEDRLYILGDVIDRGGGGIPILLDIKDRENVTFFLGNHELFLLRVFGEGDEEWMSSWLFNGGSKTAMDFMALESRQKDEILEFLRGSWGVMPDLAVGDKHYYLVHAFPDLNYLDEPVMVSQFASQEEWERLYDMVWSRVDRQDKEGWEALETLAGMERKLIIGHTVTKRFLGRPLQEGEKPRIYYDDKFTCIDCGCAMKEDRGQLGVLRLEDGAEFYF